MDESAYRNAELNYWQHYHATPAEHWLDLPVLGTKVRILEFGSGMPLLFVHGGPSAGSTFAPLAAQLGSYRCIVIDRPGCGLSPPISYKGMPHNQRMPLILKACISALELPSVNLVGSSFGGACSLWLAQQFPQLVEKIVLMGCPPFVSFAKMPLFLRLLATPAIGALLCRLPASRSGSMAYLDAMGEQQAKEAELIPEDFYAWHLSLCRDTNTMINDRKLVQYGLTFAGMRQELIISDKQLQQIQTPIQVYWGKGDPLGDANIAKDLFGSLPNGSIEINNDAGHLPWLADPIRAATAIKTFVN